jgi:hypothetical protein
MPSLSKIKYSKHTPHQNTTFSCSYDFRFYSAVGVKGAETNSVTAQGDYFKGDKMY